MTPLLFVAVAVAGGLGAGVRYVVDRAFARRGSRFPLGLLAINLSGSFLLGLVTGLVAMTLESQSWTLVLGTGFLGGYTTFSSASLETVRLLRAGRVGDALLFGIGGLIGAIALAAAGLVVGAGFLAV